MTPYLNSVRKLYWDLFIATLVPHQHYFSIYLASVEFPICSDKMLNYCLIHCSSSQWGFSQTTTMSLACLVCHGMSSPSNSLRSYSVSSSEEESRCGAAVACLARRVTPAGTSSVGTSKVTPFPPMVSGQVGTEGTPRLQRSRAVSRDLVRDWNFDEVIVAN
jgi:hypothetical protein